jgi:hypothetical protein
MALALGLSLLGPARPRPATAAPQDEITRRDFAIAGFKPPPRWEVLPRERQSYPQLLAWASRGTGEDRAVISLIGKRLPLGATLQTLIQEAAALREYPHTQGVRAQVQAIKGWAANQRVQIDAVLIATRAQRQRVVRQYLYLNPPFGYVLTLVAPQEQAAARYRDLDDTAANLVPLATEAPADQPPASPQPPPATPPQPSQATPSPPPPVAAPPQAAPGASPRPDAVGRPASTPSTNPPAVSP